MTELDILAAGNKLLQTRYGGKIPVYGREVSDGFKMPAFFTEVVSNGFTYGSKNLAELECAFKITYFQAEVDDVDQAKKVEEFRKLFGKYLIVGKRKIKVLDLETNYVGERNNILQVTINFQTVFIDVSEKHDLEIMESLEVNEHVNNNL